MDRQYPKGFWCDYLYSTVRVILFLTYEVLTVHILKCMKRFLVFNVQIQKIFFSSNYILI
jgi:hypothetical protein